MKFWLTALCMTGLLVATATAATPDPATDILVTFVNEGAAAVSSSFRAPYQNRKRYRLSPAAQRNANAVSDEYRLVTVDHWPIRSLSVYCFVYRVPEDADRDELLARLNADARVESAQALEVFRTRSAAAAVYNDTLANLQHGLAALGVVDAHRLTRGDGVRIGIVDSHADLRHEDLAGRVRRTRNFAAPNRPADRLHGTAVASVIGARADNRRGIVGIAPEATLEMYVSCWDGGGGAAICDSFTLAKALDSLLDNPPHIVNLSFAGPYDGLVSRLLDRVADAGAVMIAAQDTAPGNGPAFPASHESVIGVATSRPREDEAEAIHAPGEQIMVAIPDNAYDFRSGSSLAAAHVSGVVALLLSLSPDVATDDIVSLLRRSQLAESARVQSVDACRMLRLAIPSSACGLEENPSISSER